MIWAGTKIAIATQCPQCLGIGRLTCSGVGILAVEDQVGGIEVKPLEGDFCPLQNLAGDAGADGMTLLEKNIKRAAKPVVVELIGGNVPE